MVVYWIVGSGVALLSAVYSLRGVLKPLRATEESVDAGVEAVESSGETDAN